MAGLAGASAPVEMTEQIKELIALGAAIGASCEPCFKFHYDKARKLGLSNNAMREAVKIGEAVKQASARNILGLADRMLGSDEPKAASSSCCGGGAKATEAKPVEAKPKSCC
jgi:AhpD family alkylhydroperoxidase